MSNLVDILLSSYNLSTGLQDCNHIFIVHSNYLASAYIYNKAYNIIIIGEKQNDIIFVGFKKFNNSY